MSDLLTKVFVRPGLHRFAASDADFVRAMYVLSHPFVLLVLAYYVGLLAVPSFPQVPLGLWGAEYSEFVHSYATGEQGSYIQRFLSFFPLALVSMVITLTPRILHAEEKHWLQRWSGKTLAWHIKAILGLATIGIASFLGMLIPGDPGFCDGCTTRSVGGLFIIYGIGLPIGFALIAGCIWALSKRAIRIS